MRRIVNSKSGVEERVKEKAKEKAKPIGKRETKGREIW